MKVLRRLIALNLALIMMLTMLPLSVMAANLTVDRTITYSATDGITEHSFTPRTSGLYLFELRDASGEPASPPELYLYEGDAEVTGGDRGYHWSGKTFMLQELLANTTYTLSHDSYRTYYGDGDDKLTLSVSKVSTPDIGSAPVSFDASFWRDLYFQFTPDISGWYTISTDISAYLDCVNNNSTFEGYNDSVHDLSGNYDFDMGSSAYFTAGKTYYFRYTPNETKRCTISVSASTFPSLTENSSIAVPFTEHNVPYYIAFVPKCSATYTVTANSDDLFNVYFAALYDSQGNGLTSEGWYDWVPESKYIQYTLTAGKTYYIGVGGEEETKCTLSVSCDGGDITNPPSTAEILSLSPKNGTTDVGYDAADPPKFGIKFDREIAAIEGQLFVADVDLSMDTGFAIYRASDNELIYKPGKYSGHDFKMNYEKDQLVVVPLNNHALLKPDTEYYITMKEGFVRFVDGSTNPNIEPNQWVFKTEVQDNVSFTYASTIGSELEFSGLSYRDGWFFEDSYTYNHALAQMTLGMAMSGFEGTSKDKNIRYLLYQLGFDDEKYYSVGYGAEDNSSVAMAISQKEIIDEEGKKAILLAICLRGAGYGNGGWAGNFEVGNTGAYSHGFYKAAIKARNEIEDYINFHNIDSESVRIWLTGFSRSAATANLLSGQLRIHNLCKGDHLYTYTFATPNNQLTNIVVPYNNIFNIINPNDIVPTIPLKQWGFGKMGTSYLLPSMVEAHQKTEYFDKVTANFAEIVDSSDQYLTGGNTAATLSWVEYTLSNAVPNRNVYTTYLQEALSGFFNGDTSGMDELLCGVTTADDFIKTIEDKKYITAAGILIEVIEKSPHDYPLIPLLNAMVDLLKGAGAEYLANGNKGLENIGVVQAFISILKQGMNAPLLKEHWPEVYLAWMTSITEDDLNLTKQFKTKSLFVKCPVDISVYDEQDNLVGQIIDNVAQEIPNSPVAVSVLGEAKKIFVFPCDETYRVDIVSTGVGSMDYTITENSAEGEILRVVDFQDITLTEGQKFSGIVNEIKDTSAFDYVLTSNGLKIYPDYDSLSKYAIVFEANGGAGTMRSETVKANEVYVLPRCGFTAPTGKIFDSWSIDEVLYNVGDPYTVTCDTTVFAIWTDADTGNGSDNNRYDDNDDDDWVPAYTIVLPNNVANGRVKIDRQAVTQGSVATLTVIPDEGYELDKLVVTDRSGKELALTDKGDNKFTFVMPSSTVIVNASFRPVETTWSNPFADVSEDNWYYDAVAFAMEKGIMSGYSTDTFAPNDNLSRAMLAQILYNLEEKPSARTDIRFTDVSGDAWYSDAVLWAAENGIAQGYDGHFDPEAPITREQVATMLWNYAGKPAADNARALNYSDEDKISGWAVSAMLWATENNVMSGYDGMLDPAGQATRAQIAQMMKNYLDN